MQRVALAKLKKSVAYDSQRGKICRKRFHAHTYTFLGETDLFVPLLSSAQEIATAGASNYSTVL